MCPIPAAPADTPFASHTGECSSVCSDITLTPVPGLAQKPGPFATLGTNERLSPLLTPSRPVSEGRQGAWGRQRLGRRPPGLAAELARGQPGQRDTDAGFPSRSALAPAAGQTRGRARRLCRGAGVTVLPSRSCGVVLRSLPAVHTHEDSHMSPESSPPRPLTHPATLCQRLPVRPAALSSSAWRKRRHVRGAWAGRASRAI